MQENNYPVLETLKTLKKEYKNLNKIVIDLEDFTIGRGLENSVVIAYIALSRKHCIFKKKDNNEWLIEDTSTFGIQVNDKKLKKGSKYVLSHNDVIQLDALGEFVYKFKHEIINCEYVPVKKRIKLDKEPNTEIINDVKQKFEESQHYEIEHLEKKIQNAKQMQTTSIILKQQVELDLERKIQNLKEDFAQQIENLKGEKNQVEKQKILLEQERDTQMTAIKQEMNEKISELLKEISKQNETESELLTENALLKEKLLKEREDFLSELNRENSSKQDILNQLEAKIKQQEEVRIKERLALEERLRYETEQLKLAKEKELKELEEQKKIRELELQLELAEIKKNLDEQLHKSEQLKLKAEKELYEKIEQMKKVKEEDKMKMEHLCQARQEAENKLREAQKDAEKSLEDLTKRVNDREVELAALAAERIQKHSEQSTEMITALQEQLSKVRSELQTVETEKSVLLNMCFTEENGPSTSKHETLTKVGALIESELQCIICSELFVAATTLGCSHTFCRYCITMWKKKKKECPICRTQITSECRSLVLDTFIEKMVANLTDEMKEKRVQMLKDREELEAKLACQSTTVRNRRSHSHDESTDTNETDEFYEGEEEEDDFDEDYSESENSSYGSRHTSYHADSGSDFNSSWEQSSNDTDDDDRSRRRRDEHYSNPRPRAGQHIEGVGGSYYGGYGSCYNCGAYGHWTPGCPFR